MYLRRYIALYTLVAAIAIPGFAEDRSRWSNLRELKAGQRIGVIQSDQRRIEGRFESFTDSAITLRADQQVTIAKDSVVRVYRRPRVRRSIRAAIGGIVGAIGGALLAATVGDRFRNEGQDVPTGLWIAGGAGAGAGIGAIGGGYRTVYQRHP